MMRRALLWATAAAAVSACFVDILPVVGDGGTIDATSDVVADTGKDVVVPPLCTTLDASCLPSVPSGWAPVLVTDGGCATDYFPQHLETNPRLDDAGCGCGCTVIGAPYSCSNGNVTFTSGTSCGTSSSGAIGFCHPISSTTAFGYDAPTAGGSPSCTTNTQPAKVDTDPLTACAPLKCSVDFCGGSGEPCISTSGNATCPPGFPHQITAGNGPTGTCPKCGCNVSPAPTCTGTLAAYSDFFCGTKALATTSSPGTCNPLDASAISLKYVDTTDASTSCTATTSDGGSASFSSTTTICCVN